MDTKRHLSALLCVGLLLAPSGMFGAEKTTATTTPILALKEALRRSEAHNAALQSARFELAAYSGGISQAGVWLNPELDLEAENVLGSGGLGGVQGGEFTLSLAQTIQLGGKRSKAVALARSEQDAALYRFEAARLSLLAEVAAAFADALAAQEMEKANTEFVQLAREGAEAVRVRIEAGVSNEAELAKAQIALARGRIDASKARRQKLTALRHLGSYWGNRGSVFDTVAGNLYMYFPAPDLKAVLARVEGSPEILAALAAVAAVEQQFVLQKSRRIPDLTVAAGGRFLSESGDVGLVAGLSMPLPVFDRNQGNLASAKSLSQAAAARAAATKIELDAQLGELWQRLSALVEELDEMNKVILPQAQRAYDASKKLYQQGRFGYLDLLDAQRTLFEQRILHINASAEYHQVVASIEGRIGTSLASLNQNK